MFVRVLLDYGVDVHAVDEVSRCSALLNSRMGGVYHV